MYTLNIKKFQNTPRGKDGRASAVDKRSRLPSTAFEDESIPGRIRTLHPTKGWRSRNLGVMRRNGSVIREINENA